MAERRAALLNRQQMELSDLDQRLQEDEAQVQRTAAADWEVAFARDKLALKERHYKVGLGLDYMCLRCSGLCCAVPVDQRSGKTSD